MPGLEGRSEEEIRALATMTASILDNPATRTMYQRVLKKANPGISIPEIDTQDAVAAALAARDAKFAALEAEREQEKAQRSANALYDGLKEGGIVGSKADFQELVKYANEKGYRTDEAGLSLAGRVRAQEQEAAEPTPLTASLTNVLQRDNKDLLKDPVGWARNAANQAIEDLRKKGQKAFGGRAAA